MKIHSSKLQRIFKYLTPSMNGALKMPEFNSFLFDATENQLMVRIYDGVTESIVKMNGEFEPMKFAVDEFIYQVVNHLNGDITFKLDGTNLLIDCGPKHYEFATIDCETWIPIVENSPADEAFDLENVKKFNKTKHCVATDESRPIYTGYHIRNGRLFASDGFRAIMIPTTLIDCSFTAKELDSILRCLDGNVYYKFDDAIYFKCESDEFVVGYTTGKLDGEPFDPVRLFNEKESHEVLGTIKFVDLVKKLKDIEILQRQALKLSVTFYLTILVENAEVYFCTDITGLSTSKELIGAKVDGNDFTLNLNPTYLMDFAKVADGAVTMKITDPKGEPVLLYDESETKSLIMPMNVK